MIVQAFLLQKVKKVYVYKIKLLYNNFYKKEIKFKYKVRQILKFM